MCTFLIFVVPDVIKLNGAGLDISSRRVERSVNGSQIHGEWR